MLCGHLVRGHRATGGTLSFAETSHSWKDCVGKLLRRTCSKVLEAPFQSRISRISGISRISMSFYIHSAAEGGESI